MSKTRIVIVGGGFAGVKCARILRKKLRPDEAEITIFNRENHMVFHPMLAEVAGGSLNPDAVAAPLRQMLPKVMCRTEDVVEVRPDAREVVFENYEGRNETIPYDHCVLACGGVVNLGMVPGMADHAFPLKTVGDAVALRAHIMQQLEKAEVCADAEKRRWYLTFIVIGGGYSGVEAAGEINDLARGSRKFFQNIRPEDIRVCIVHSRDQLLPEIGAKLRDFTRAKMEKAGVEVVLEARAAMVTHEGIFLKDGREIPGATVVCTIGSTASPIIKRLEVELDGNRPRTEPDMRVVGKEDLWAVGDCASVINAHDGKPSPPTGQFAERQGKQTAYNILRVLKGEPTKPFSFKPVGQLCSIGGHRAVAEIMGMRLSGFIAWVMWRLIYLMKLPTWARRIKVGFDWAWQVVFSRDLTHLRQDRTSRVSRALYKSGDYIFKEGDPATDFYVVESGEVEVVRKDGDQDEVLALLGPGDFFGEMALLSDKPRNAAVRARVDTEAVVMGKNVFKQVSGSLAPLQDLLTRAVVRRGESNWHRTPRVQEALESVRIGELLTSTAQREIQDTATFQDCLDQFQKNDVDYLCVKTADGSLRGVVDRGNFLRAVEEGLLPESPVTELMTEARFTVTPNDFALVAAGTMKEQGLVWLPVVTDSSSRRLVGAIEADDMLARVLKS
ncbi:MAG: FAD-dependent oxidoreductase [Planctomycetota bacterium]